MDTDICGRFTFRPILAKNTGAGVIFGATGGVMEAALRSAHYLVTGRNPDPDAFKIVRSPSFETGVVGAEVQIGDATIRAAVVSGLGNVRKLLEAIEHGEVHYDFVEVMACPGGCVGGGGQPIHDGEELAHTRGANLYFLDKNAKIRFSHENQDVMKLYNDFLEKPLSHKSHDNPPLILLPECKRFIDEYRVLRTECGVQTVHLQLLVVDEGIGFLAICKWDILCILSCKYLFEG